MPGASLLWARKQKKGQGAAIAALRWLSNTETLIIIHPIHSLGAQLQLVDLLLQVSCNDRELAQEQEAECCEAQIDLVRLSCTVYGQLQPVSLLVRLWPTVFGCIVRGRGMLGWLQ